MSDRGLHEPIMIKRPWIQLEQKVVFRRVVVVRED